MRCFTRSLIIGAVALGAATPVWSDTDADQLAEQIETCVRQAISATRPPRQEASVVRFEQFAATASWTEVWPGAGGETIREVTGKLWNAPIRMALAKHGAAFLPKRDEPYYINDPIVLESGQWLCADREAEIRLVPSSNTCMVRNESLVSGQSGPIPADAKPDAQIIIEGGIWTTLATSPTQSNGNVHGRSARRPVVPSCHGVIILSNVRGVAIRNVVVRQSRAHAVQLSNCSEFLVEGVVFDEHRRDGIHVNGPASYGIIRNIRGVTGDDFVALNAWDWCHTAPAFGPIHHILVEAIHGDPQLGGTDEIRLLPGTKTFADGRKLDCSIHDCVLRDFHDIRTFKIYDQPNLELGRGRDFCDPIGTVRNVFFDNLAFNRAGRFQLAVHVDGLSINDVQLNYDVKTTGKDDAKLVEIGPMSQTYKFDANNPATWVELFSPNRDITVRGFSLTNVRVKAGDAIGLLQHAEDRLVRIADQKPNPNYPKTTPRGGTGKAIFIDKPERTPVFRIRNRTKAPLLRADKPWESCAVFGGTVVRENTRWRMWYGAYDRNHKRDDDGFLCYAESSDGVHWTKPDLGIVAYEGNKNNNILISSQQSGGFSFSYVFLDEGKDVRERYKMIWHTKSTHYPVLVVLRK